MAPASEADPPLTPAQLLAPPLPQGSQPAGFPRKKRWTLLASDPLAFRPIDDDFGNTPLDDLPVIAFDTETGGLDPLKDALLTVGLACIDGPIADLVVCHEDYRPDEKVLAVNRITSGRAAGGSPWRLVEQLLEEQFDGRVVVGHDVGFDLGFLMANSPNLPLPFAVDTAACCRFLWPGAKADLASLCERARIDNANAHGAGGDAWAAMRGWIYLRNVLRNAGITTWNELCATQAEIPQRMARGPWPDEVVAIAGRAQREGVGPGGRSASA